MTDFVRSILRVSLVLAALTVCGLLQAAPAGLKMHRVQAGEPDAKARFLAVSNEGGFSVRLPLKFNDFTLSETDPKTPVLRTFIVGAKSQEGIKFTATRIVYRKGAASAKHFFSRFEKGQDIGSEPHSVRRHEFRGMPAVDLELRTASHVSWQRVVLLESDLLMMVVESPRPHHESAQPFAADFFDSLVVIVQ